MLQTTKLNYQKRKLDKIFAQNGDGRKWMFVPVAVSHGGGSGHLSRSLGVADQPVKDVDLEFDLFCDAFDDYETQSAPSNFHPCATESAFAYFQKSHVLMN